ncbi:MAG: ABC transporter ATP-binding protein, partial [Promethearchaeota archaeon]
MITTDQDQYKQEELPVSTDEPIIRVRNLKKFFPIYGGVFKKVVGHVYAVNDVSFDIKKGETIGIVGESGCGKTTLGRTILGLTPVTDGQIIYKDTDITQQNQLPEDREWKIRSRLTALAILIIGLLLFVLGLMNFAQNQYLITVGRFLELPLLTIFLVIATPFGLILLVKGILDLAKLAPGQLQLRRDIQIVFQDPHASLNPRMTVRGALSESLIVHKTMPKEEIDEYLISLLEEVGLGEMHLDRFPHEFSGGQRQRIVIARALVLQPDVVILDEPTASTDVSVQAKTLNLLNRLQRDKQLTFLFISHDLSVIKHMSKRIFVMYLGKIVEIGLREMFSKPEKIHPYTEALFEAVPVADPTFRDERRIILGGDVPSPANPPPGCVFHTRCPFALKDARLMDICQKEEPLLTEVEKDHSMIVLGCYCEDCDKYYTFYLDFSEMEYHSMNTAGKRIEPPPL